jgi:hypothetical protein
LGKRATAREEDDLSDSVGRAMRCAANGVRRGGPADPGDPVRCLIGTDGTERFR